MNIREDLKAYLDGELSPQRMEEVRAALEADPALREELEFMRLMGFEIKRMAAEPHVAGVEGALGRLRGFRWPPFASDRRWQFVGGSMVVVVALIGVSNMIGRQYESVRFGITMPQLPRCLQRVTWTWSPEGKWTRALRKELARSTWATGRTPLLGRGTPRNP
ncbi:MAG: hypothetical protein K8H99_09720 [Nitrospirae bacterium]|nr:hypothetical protein [Fimbriimonadaceae bacterium]